jgi:hypothetical protein
VVLHLLLFLLFDIWHLHQQHVLHGLQDRCSTAAAVVVVVMSSTPSKAGAAR